MASTSNSCAVRKRILLILPRKTYRHTEDFDSVCLVAAVVDDDVRLDRIRPDRQRVFDRLRFLCSASLLEGGLPRGEPGQSREGEALPAADSIRRRRRPQ